MTGVPDTLLGLLFVIAFFKARRISDERTSPESEMLGKANELREDRVFDCTSGRTH